MTADSTRRRLEGIGRPTSSAIHWPPQGRSLITDLAILAGKAMSHGVAKPLIRSLELFCGIGGFAAATRDQTSIAAAVDINQNAIEVYRHNFAHSTVVATTECISLEQLEGWGAELWWMSPPCQPFTHRGRRLDIEDRRAMGFLRLLESFARIQPLHLALENVPGFAGSRAHCGLRRLLDKLDYNVAESVVCPTQLGFPNRRKRFYLVASREALDASPACVATLQPLREFLDPEPAEALWVDPDLPCRYPKALNVVDADDPDAVTACFTAAYGHSPVRSGSYLRTSLGLRRFSPREILRLLGFPEDFSLPAQLPVESAWRLIGNSLSLPVVRLVLSTLPSMPRLLEHRLAAVESPIATQAPIELFR